MKALLTRFNNDIIQKYYYTLKYMKGCAKSVCIYLQSHSQLKEKTVASCVNLGTLTAMSNHDYNIIASFSISTEGKDI